jgi:hypothetical protein
MKTTLNIADPVFAQLKREAARQGRTMGELVEAGLRLLFQAPKKKKAALPAIPTFDMGRELVDVSDREALYRVLDDAQ